MLDHCRRHLAGVITATELERQILDHADALEGMKSSDTSPFTDFGYKFVEAQFDDGTTVVLTEFEFWLAQLTERIA